MAKSKLVKVVHRAFHDDKFHTALVRNPARAIEKARIKLSKADMKKLKTLLRRRSVINDFKHYKRLHNEYRIKKPTLGVLW